MNVLLDCVKRNRVVRSVGCGIAAGLLLAVSHGLTRQTAAQTNAPEGNIEQRANEAARTGRPPLSFMRRKLGSTQKVLEGLTTENMRLVVEGSDELLAIADEASWKVSRDAYYIHYSRDFQRTIRGLQDAAKRGRVEEATFAYTHAMVSCMACHRHVRGVVPVSAK